MCYIGLTRKWYNKLITQSSKESVKVIVRCRPISEREISNKNNACVEVCLDSAAINILDEKGGNKTFTFDSVFDKKSRQIDVYNQTARPIVESVLEGYNGTVFAYGQTGLIFLKKGTGKTFSMEGIRGDLELCGIIPNSFLHIFQHISHSKDETKFFKDKK